MLEYNNTLQPLWVRLWFDIGAGVGGVILTSDLVYKEFINMPETCCFNLLGIYPTIEQISTQVYKIQTAPVCKTRLVWFESPREEGVCSQPETSSNEFEEFLSSKRKKTLDR